MPVSVKQATIADLDAVVPLFEACRHFLSERLERGESIILVAATPDGSGIQTSILTT